jgi:hypothetical protein
LNPRLCSLMVRKWSTGPISLSYTTTTLLTIFLAQGAKGRGPAEAVMVMAEAARRAAAEAVSE